ncbi:26S proteasome regulatory subunit 6A, partial [Cryomyces antarcticus]
MSTLEDLDDLENEGKEEEQKKDENGDVEMSASDKKSEARKKEVREVDALIDSEILNSSTRDIMARKRLLENDTRIMRSEF